MIIDDEASRFIRVQLIVDRAYINSVRRSLEIELGYTLDLDDVQLALIQAIIEHTQQTRYTPEFLDKIRKSLTKQNNDAKTYPEN